MQVQHFFDPRTSSLSYVVHDGSEAIAIDAVLDYDPRSGRVFHESADQVLSYVKRQGLNLRYALDTHPHADHLSAQAYLKAEVGCQTGIGAGITRVQETWREIFDLPDLAVDGSQFDVLLADGDTLEFGDLQLEAILTEGHTPASLTYKIGDAIFVGDVIFMPDAGTARCDFPGGSAEVMFDAIQRLYELPDETRVFTLHDYQPGGRELRFVSTIGDQKARNVHISAATSREEFVELRRELERDKPAPQLLFPAVQVNINGGELPAPAANGISYLKIPLNQFKSL
tara:strand:+ start:3532 stop:4386 length:855 start_codon:yes stop_codon:yes gene_type:complete